METISGIIDHFLYRRVENGYTVMEVSCEDDDYICVGTVAGIEEGELVEITGDWVTHPMYGPQIKINSIRIVEPTGLRGIERYLGSGIIKGVGPKIATRIIKAFGEDTLRIIEEEPERLAEIKGVSERLAQNIAVQMLEKKEQQDAFIYMAKYGITQALAVKIYNTFGNLVFSVIEENPYRIIDEVDGVGFKKADEIANKVGIKVDSQFRIQSGIVYVLSNALGEGHTYLPIEELKTRSAALLGVSEKAIEEELPNLIMDCKIVVKNEVSDVNVYTNHLYHQELSCAAMLKELNDVKVKCNEADLDRRIENAQNELNITLDDMQRFAVKESLKSGVLIITGGPGTGKTTTINAIIHLAISQGLEVMLAAPTGRAAKRMTEATGYEARTIHRMLEINGAISEGGRSAYFDRNKENPLEADVVIIDEMSMVDVQLFYALLNAIPIGARLIMVGDVNQLPSVGPGQVLKDLIESESFPTVILNHIFRQASESDIVNNAHRINNGQPIALNTKSKDFLFLERNDPQVIYKHMIELITGKLPQYVGASPMQVQVLTPTHIGSLGVEALNKVLQKYLNPPSDTKKEKEYGDTIFRVGDKVMQTKNNYTLEWEVVSKYGIAIDRGAGVFNGDVGTVVDISQSVGYVMVEYDDKRKVKYPLDGLDELELAYAITIHKSQGSEYPAVILPLLGGPRPLLNRNLLYTAVTRARKCVMILGSTDTVNTMISNKSESQRFTGLYMRIKEIME